MPITLLTASALGLIFLYLCFAVVRARIRSTASLGTGKDTLNRDEDPKTQPLLVAVRSHANFAEYVPISLILLGLLEGQGFAPWIIASLGGALVVSRAMHPLGMELKPPNVFRAGGILLQWALLAIMVGMGIWSSAPAVAALFGGHGA
jgi:uncharacterized protein